MSSFQKPRCEAKNDATYLHRDRRKPEKHKTRLLDSPHVAHSCGGLFETESDMSKDDIVIKVLRVRGGVITWCYDKPREANRAWKTICETGATHDTTEPVQSAAYFKGDNLEKSWIAPPTIESVAHRFA